jgi:dihydroneopterin aldolase
MLTIEFNKLRFFGYHGLYEEEAVVGEEFELDIFINYWPLATPVKHLTDTLDYVSVYGLVKDMMEKREDLLEAVAHNIAQGIIMHYVFVDEVKVIIRKLHPPITNFTGSIGIHYTLKRNP